MGLLDSFLNPDDASSVQGSGLGTGLSAIGMALMSGNSRAPFANLPQAYASVASSEKSSMSRAALKQLLIQKGYSEAEADKYSTSETATKLALQEKENQGFEAMVKGGFSGGAAPSMSPSAPAGPAAGVTLNGPTANGLAPPSGNSAEVQSRFVDALKQGGLTNPVGLGAVAAYGQHESGYSPDKIAGSWSDPSESGQAGTSGGLLSWREGRLRNMQAATAGAKDPVAAQAGFFLNESPELTAALQNAKTPEEANRLMAEAWKFAGYNRPGGENAARLATTRSFVSRLGADGAPQQVADAGASASPRSPVANDASPSRPVQIANDENQTQVLESRMGMLPKSIYGIVPPTQTAAADAPVPGATEAAFEIPPGGAQSAPKYGLDTTTGRALAARQQASAADEERQINEGLAKIAMSGRYGEKGKAYAEAIKLQIQPLLENRKQTDAQKLVRASGVSDEDAQSLLRGAIPGAAPTATQKEYGSYRQQEIASGRQPLSQFDYDVALSKAKANSTKVEIGGEKAYDSGQGKDYSDVMKEVQTAGRKAPSLIATLGQAEQLMSTPGFVSGLGSTFALPAKQLIAALGGDPKAPASMEAFRSLSNRAVTDALGGSLGAGVSNADVSFLQKQVASLDNSVEGNRAILANARRVAEHQRKIAEFANDYADKNGGRIDRNFDRALSKWADQNPIFTAEERDGGGQRAAQAPLNTTDRAVSIKNAKAFLQANPGQRDAVMKRLRDNGIPTDGL